MTQDGYESTSCSATSAPGALPPKHFVRREPITRLTSLQSEPKSINKSSSIKNESTSSRQPSNATEFTIYHEEEKDSNDSTSSQSLSHTEEWQNSFHNNQHLLQTAPKLKKNTNRGGRRGAAQKKRRMEGNKSSQQTYCDECFQLMPSRSFMKSLKKKHGDHLHLNNFKNIQNFM